jgi:hypothetical protein
MVIDLGEQPTPRIEPAEPPPGGVDAVEDLQYEPDPVVPDVIPFGNTPARDVPDEVTEPETTEDGPSSDGASAPEQEAPA